MTNEAKKIVLYIDTSSNEEIAVGLIIDNKKDITKEKVGREKAQVVLPLLQKLLKKHRLNLNDLTAIEVETGPGSFTGLRVGVSIANTLGYFLHIPINGKEAKDLVEPKYA